MILADCHLVTVPSKTMFLQHFLLVTPSATQLREKFLSSSPPAVMTLHAISTETRLTSTAPAPKLFAKDLPTPLSTSHGSHLPHAVL